MNISFLKNKNLNLKTLRILGTLEGISYLMLFGITMPLKYSYDMPTPNYIVGVIHGILFIGFGFWTLLIYKQYNLSIKDTLLLLISSLLPFGTFVADKKILSKLTE